MNKPDVLADIRAFSSIVRMAFSRYQDGLSEKEVRAYVRQRFQHNSWFIQSAVKEAKLKYRFLLSDYVGNAVLSKTYNKQKWIYHVFA